MLEAQKEDIICRMKEEVDREQQEKGVLVERMAQDIRQLMRHPH